MARIPRELVDAVRERTDIAEVIGRHVSLVRRGRNLVGLCPFHQEKTPSFNVIPDKGIYHCFGCQAGGDVFRFLMTLEGLSFIEAIKELATSAGITVEERELTPAERRGLAQRASAFEVLEAAAKFYEAQLWTGPAGAVARAYLENRKMTPETARTARLGWAPGGWTRLLDHLHREGYEPDQLADAGVAKAKETGGHYDWLRERVVVPIRDEKGRVIAFGGRILEGDGPKYLNTPETRLYLKSQVLYGLDQARMHIQRKGRVVVVEGYFDVLSLHQAGFGEAVATCGTALTAEHLEKIRRHAKDVLLVMDADEAGLRAAERSLPLFVDAGIQPWRVDLRGAKDPDELIQTAGADAFTAILEAREPLFEWVIQRKLDGYGASSMSRERVLDDVLPMLARLRDPLLVNQVARRIGMNEEVVKQRLREHRPTEGESPPPPPAPKEGGWQPHRDVVHLLWLAVHRYDEVADLLTRADPSLLDAHAQVRPILARLLSGEPIAAVIQEVSEPSIVRTLLAIVARDGLYPQESAARSAVEVLHRLWKPRHTAHLAQLTDEIRSLEGRDHERLLIAMREIQLLQGRERQYDRALRAGKLDEALSLLALVPTADGNP